MAARILVVEDESGMRFLLRELLEEAGYEVVEAANGRSALERLEGVELVLTDLLMPDMDGMALLKQLGLGCPELPAIVLTAQGSEKAAVAAMRAGAFDYHPKPFDREALLLAVQRALRHGELQTAQRRSEGEKRAPRQLIGSAPVFLELLELTRRVAGRDVGVLITGETGTGKELIATLLHAHSPRNARPLVRFNCAAIVESLGESELFGHEKGAFSGAQSRHDGYFQRAAGGTLVLDEVGELSPALQAKLLRALQSGEVQRVGARASERVDLRVVACTHRDLRREVEAGRFREDLLYRLQVVTLHVPALRERRTDVLALANAFRRGFAQRFGVDDQPFPDEVVHQLENHDWPGNVRELENTIARWLAMSPDGLVRAESAQLGAEPALPPAPNSSGPLRQRVRAYERSLLKQALNECTGNHSAAARSLGITRTTLLDKLKRHGLR